MGYLFIKDFQLGMDRRKPRVAGVPGSLWTLKNAMITRGGMIQRAKKFVSTYSPEAGKTFGLGAVRGELYVFGSEASPTVPAGLNYQRLQHPDGTTDMTRVLDVDTFDGKLYVVARFADNQVFHFYDGVLVTDWSAGIVAAYDVDMAGFAARLAEAIDASASYIATSASNVITITGEGSLAVTAYDAAATSENGGAVDDQDTTVTITQAADDLTDPQITDVTLGGTFDPGDRFSVLLGDGATAESYGFDGSPYPVAEIVLTFKNKVYAAGGSLVNFSAVDRPDLWNRDNQLAVGAGFVNASNQDGGSDEVTGLEIYQGSMAIFAPNAVQIWAMSDDPAENVLLQTLKNTGTKSPRSTRSFGSMDVFYLASSGIRTLRARDNTNTAYANDIGTPIDDFVQSYVRTVTDDQIERAVAVIEPLDDRYWLALADRVFVFSYFPGSKISAWSYLEPGFEIEDFARIDDSLYVRAGDTIYRYGGPDGDTYPDADEMPVLIETPFFDANKAATRKQFSAYDQGALGTWNAYVLPDPNNENLVVAVGPITDITYQLNDIRKQFRSTHVAVRLECAAAGNAAFYSLALHHDMADSG